MDLYLYNTLAREKQKFEPRDPGRVGMYVCGPTVYDRAHIGNARPVIVFDVLYRLLRHIYGAGNVTYVRNITDIDDKINAASKETGEPIESLTQRTTELFHADMAALGALPPDHEPRATQHVAGMIDMATTLIERGHAYEAESHVLFNVPSMPDYGGLSRRSLDEMIAGARVDVAPYKKHPADFVLWKPSTPDLPGWDSPWGRGRPGWHLECSVMCETFLGVPVDIHGGGQDLIFPHHENERAQTLCAHGIPRFANYWVHNGFVNMGEKMSKSLGNILTVEEVLKQVGGRGAVARLMMLSTHYRKPLDWTPLGMREAKVSADRLYTALKGLTEVKPNNTGDIPESVMTALLDDLNTPKALAEIHAIGNAANKATGKAERARLKGALVASGNVLGLLEHDLDAYFKGRITGTGELTLQPVRVKGTGTVTVQMDAILVKEVEWIEKKIAERNDARKAKDFAAADKIRDELEEKGILLEDRPDGTTDWKRAG